MCISLMTDKWYNIDDKGGKKEGRKVRGGREKRKGRREKEKEEEKENGSEGGREAGKKEGKRMQDYSWNKNS